LDGVDVVCFMINADGWKEEDLHVLNSISDTGLPIILLINKLDRLTSVNELLPLIEESSKQADFAEIIPISALKGSNVEHAVETISGYLPNQPAGFDEDQITDRSFRFLVSELLREQLFRRLGDELPYATAVEITRFEKEGSVFQISADIWVDRPSHKAMVIGKQGAALKQIGAAARRNIESLLDSKVFIELWVKVRTGWSDNARDLHSLGYDEDNF
jgi:GTP-binding protein Era